MPLTICLVREYETTHEREIFSSLSKKLEHLVSNNAESILLIGNLNCSGDEIDALVIKQDSITVIEFKNYGGEILFSENGDWIADNKIIAGGSGGKNPYHQVKNYKFSLLNILRMLLTSPNVNLGHITAIVVFHKKIKFNEETIPPKIHSWFHICDFDSIEEKLHNITSREINLTPDEIFALPKAFQIENKIIGRNLVTTKKTSPIKIQSLKSNSSDEISDNLSNMGLKIVHQLILNSRAGKTFNIETLFLAPSSMRYLKEYNSEIYQHQYEAIKSYQTKANVCLTTSTSSGKSLVFYSAGIEEMSKDNDAFIIAIYPLKALANQQEESWREALISAGLENKVGRIDGSVSISQRMDILKKSSILVMTPDILHAWFMQNLQEKEIQKKLSKTKLVIIDEVHNYSGVFGSNSAFLYRRLNHAVIKLSGKQPQYLAASATISNVEKHLFSLTGLDFIIIDNSFDTSPKHNIKVYFVESNKPSEMFGKLTELIKFFAVKTTYQSITFLDGRKMVEQTATIIARGEAELDVETMSEEDNTIGGVIETDEIKKNNVLPFRAGYEKEDSERIQKLLKQGKLKGVISTSALEMGIDIKGLDLGILVGVPLSATSLYQRTGRIGRHKDGVVIILNNYSMRSLTIFKKPDELFSMPLTESSLYLENERLQFIHAMCFASQDGEYDKLSNNSDNIETTVIFPNNFIELCNNLKKGIIPTNLREMYNIASNNPYYSYPLRDFDTQFKVKKIVHSIQQELGQLNHSQLLREAYPGAVYYYIGRPFRVHGVRFKDYTVLVQSCRYYHTQPIFMPTLIYPNISSDGTFKSKKCGKLLVMESEVFIVENIIGWKEKRGKKELTIQYPVDIEGIRYDKNRFSRKYFTTAVILSHPELQKPKVQIKLLSELLWETFLLIVPYERQDTNYGYDKFRIENEVIKKDNKFICLYDNSHGSLRLTSKLTDDTILKRLFEKTIEILSGDRKDIPLLQNNDISDESIKALAAILKCLSKPSINVFFQKSSLVPVIQPGSIGLFVTYNLKCDICGVKYTAQGVKYEISYLKDGATFYNSVSLEEIESIKKISKHTYYDIDKAELISEPK